VLERSDLMHATEILLGLLVAVAALATVARKIGVPYPIVMLLGGLGLGFVPGLPRIELAPELIFLLFLPPLVFLGSVFSSTRDLRLNLGPIASYAVGLVLATMVVVAGVAHAVLRDITWTTAFVLGTVVSATDVVAATSVTEGLPAPRRIITVLQGEGLLNDPTSLVGYRMAVVAVVTGAFSLGQAALHLVESASGGLAIGLAVSWLAIWVRQHLEDTPVEMTVSLLTPFAAYLPAEWLGVSGIVAVAAAGLYVGWMSPIAVPPETRLRIVAVWEMIGFLVTGILFILLGFQSRAILGELAGRSTATLVGFPLLICATVILVRITWVFVSTYLPATGRRGDAETGRRGDRAEPSFSPTRPVAPSPRLARRAPPWQETAVVAWTGVRGVDTLAAALALPFVTARGAPFPERSLIIFVAFCVILVTLVVQGLSLPALIRWLGVAEGGENKREETKARLAAARAALDRIDALAGQEGVSDGMVQRLRSLYQHRADHLEAHVQGTDDGSSPEHLSAHEHLRLEALEAEREAVIQLRNRGEINDEVLRRIQRDLDLEELRLEA
jgi:NhaP-type Na+/H+ or K+/H+ antiporter